MARPTIDAAIDRYLDAASRAGVREPDGPATEADLAAVQDAIAPLALADDVLVMWRRLQAPAMPYPEWIQARHALDFWRLDGSASGRSLPIFPIAYESQGYLSASLVGDGRESAIWSWAYDADPARLRYWTLAVAFDAVADAIDQGVFEWRAEHQYLELRDDVAWEAIVSARNAAAAAAGASDPGVDTVDLYSPLSWPETWQLAAGVDVRAAAPRGPSATIRDHRGAMTTPATIVGTIVALVGSGEGSRVTIDDGTGRLAVWCPAAADAYHAVRLGQRVEIDLAGSAGKARGVNEGDVDRLKAAVQDAATRGDLAGAQAAALSLAGLLEPGSADAVAVAVRPAGD